MPRRSFSRTSSQPPISARTSPASSWAILLPCLAAGRMFVGDAVPSRLGTTRAQGAETANFEEEHPVETLIRLTGGGGVGCIIDAVGVDSYHAHQRPAAKPKKSQKGQLQGREWKRTTPPVTTSGAVTGFSAIDAYNSSDERKPGLIKAELEPQAMAT